PQRPAFPRLPKIVIPTGAARLSLSRRRMARRAAQWRNLLFSPLFANLNTSTFSFLCALGVPISVNGACPAPPRASRGPGRGVTVPLLRSLLISIFLFLSSDFFRRLPQFLHPPPRHFRQRRPLSPCHALHF